MDSVKIGRLDAFIEFSPHDWGDSSRAPAMIVTLLVGSLTASSTVESHYAFGWRDLLDWMIDLEMNWKGWTGNKYWSSLEHDLRMTAHHSGGQIEIEVELDQPFGKSTWNATTTILLDPGEQLSRAVSDLGALLTSHSAFARFVPRTDR